MISPDLQKILPQVREVALTAGDFIRREALSFDPSTIKQKGLNDLVSYVDRNSEKIIVDGLENMISGAGFIAEENTADRKGEYNWIIDPLDGTTNFIHGIPCYAVSIGLEHKNEVILGVVLEVSRNELFEASNGNGAYLNGKRIQVSSCNTLQDSLIATGFPVNDFTRIKSTLGAAEHFMRHTHGVRRIGAAAADMCFLACGRVDGFFEYNLKPWDVAAGAVIIREAGGIVSDFSGNQDWLYGKEICAAAPPIYDAFLGIIKENFLR
jgi:myo-inositol-1(or 4)-monophosphatase